MRIDIVDNTSGSYGLHLDQRPAPHRPAQNLPQRRSMAGQGMSGAAVFCADLLMGMVTHGGGEAGQEQLEAVPARQLLEDRRFCDILQEASGTRPRLEAADLDGLFDGLPQQAAAASYFLSPHSEVVDFTGLDTELSTLTSWCNTGQSIDVAVVDGPGGAGKTRLGVELARRLSERRPEAEWQPGSPDIPWTAGFLSQTPVHHAPPYTMLRYLTRPALIVIDQAESRLEQIEQLLAALAGGHTPARPIRVLLLTHSSRGWWNQFQLHHPGHTTGVHISLETERALPAPHPRPNPGTRRDQLQQTPRQPPPRRRERRLGRLPSRRHSRSTSRHTTKHPRRVLHHAAHGDRQPAQRPVRPHGRPHQRPTGSPGELTDNLPASITLLDHELTYIHRTTPAGTDPELITTLIALTGMTEIHTTEEAQAVIKTAWHHHHPTQPLTSDTLTHLTGTLTRLYPPPDGSPWTNPGPTLTTALIHHLENTTNTNTTSNGNSNSHTNTNSTGTGPAPTAAAPRTAEATPAPTAPAPAPNPRARAAEATPAASSPTSSPPPTSHPANATTPSPSSPTPSPTTPTSPNPPHTPSPTTPSSSPSTPPKSPTTSPHPHATSGTPPSATPPPTTPTHHNHQPPPRLTPRHRAPLRQQQPQQSRTHHPQPPPPHRPRPPHPQPDTPRPHTPHTPAPQHPRRRQTHEPRTTPPQPPPPPQQPHPHPQKQTTGTSTTAAPPNSSP